MSRDRIAGAIVGHALGDALGAPVEIPPFGHYTGQLLEPIVKKKRGYKNLVSAVGQVTDDTEMAIALFRAIDQGYTKETAVLEYMNWANNRHSGRHSVVPFLGKNTRSLLVIGAGSEPSIKLYNNRFKKTFPGQKEIDSALSNGSLMRAYPLALLTPEQAVADCAITNPGKLAMNTVLAYTQAVRMALCGLNKQEIMISISSHIHHKELIKAYKQACLNEFRDVTNMRGYIVHGFYCAFWALFNFEDYRSAIDAVISLSPEEKVPAKFCSPGKQKNVICGDTDTNAAIAGALLGAYYGFSKMREDETTNTNIDVLLTCDPNTGDIPRPARYLLNEDNLIEMLKIAERV